MFNPISYSSRPNVSAPSAPSAVEQANRPYVNAEVTFDSKIPKEVADLCFRIAQGMGAVFAPGYNRIHVIGYKRNNESDNAGWTHVKKGMRVCDIHLGILKNADWKTNKKQRGAIIQTFFHEVFLHGNPALDRESEGRSHKNESSDHMYVYSPAGENNSFLNGIKNILPYVPKELREPFLREYSFDVKTVIEAECNTEPLKSQALKWAESLHGLSQNSY